MIAGVFFLTITDLSVLSYPSLRNENFDTDTFLIGSLESPSPLVECEQCTSLPSGDDAGLSYDIKLVSIKSMVPYVI